MPRTSPKSKMSESLADDGLDRLAERHDFGQRARRAAPPHRRSSSTRRAGGTSSVWNVKLSGVSSVPWRSSRPLIDTLWTPSAVVGNVKLKVVVVEDGHAGGVVAVDREVAGAHDSTAGCCRSTLTVMVETW